MKNIYLSLFLFCLTTNLNAQWTKIHESEQGSIGVIHSLSEEEVWFANQYQTSLTQIKNSDIQITSFENYGFLSDIQFFNQDVGYLSGGCYFVFEECPSTTLYKTSDGGENWENVFSNFFSVGVVKGISLPSENDIFAFAEYDGLIHSSDAGETWETISLPSAYMPNTYIDAQFLTPELGYFAFINGYEVIPEGYAWESVVLLTEDGGDTWQQVFSTQLPNNQLTAIHFTTSEIGYLVAQDNQIYKTENGGQSWETITIGSDQERVLNFALVNPNVAYLSTSSGEEFKSRIYKTENGGQSWTVDASFDSTFVEQLHFIDEENGFAGVGNVLYQRMGTTNTVQPTRLDFEIFPNPSSDLITIQFEDISSFPLSLIVRNQLGQVVMERQIFNTNSSISIHHLSPSVYYLELRADDGSPLGTQKLIKK
jgi:photosystem II stability/assembly factor-like uncharacterized protein